MKRFMNISLAVLWVYFLFFDNTVAMDAKERDDYQEITFSAHQKLFHAKLEKLKSSITKFPSVFLSYYLDDQDQLTFINTLSTDLEIAGFTLESSRPGGPNDVHGHSDKILKADKVILIGSPFVKKTSTVSTSENEKLIAKDVTNIRNRISNKGLTGLIFAWFTGTKAENYPEGLQHIFDRFLGTGNVYFENFFEFLSDIFHTEDNGASIVENIKKQQESFKRQKEISSDVLEQYQAMQLKHLQGILDQDTRELLEILRPFAFESLEPFYGESTPLLVDWMTRLHQVLSFHPPVLQDPQPSSSQTSLQYPIILSSSEVLYFSPQQHSFLFPNGQFKRMNNSMGKRDVAILENEGQGLFFKRFPGLPGFEAAVRSLSHLLFGHGAPYSILARMNHEPYLISQGMGRDKSPFNPEEPFAAHHRLNLAYVLKHCPEKLDLIDPESLSQAIILAILTNPEDGQPANYVLEPILDLHDNEERYRLVCIDNDQSFVDEVTLAPSGIATYFSAQPHVQVKCWLYCLDAMRGENIHDSVIQKFKQLDIPTFLRQWLQLLHKTHDGDQKLFTAIERYNLWQNHQTYIGVPFRTGDIEGLATKLLLIQDFLYKNPNATHYKLLKNVQPWIAHRYKPYLQQNFPPSVPPVSPALLRFLHADGPSYGLKVEKGQIPNISVSLSSSHDILDPKKITVRKPTKDAINDGDVFDPHAIMIELAAFIERHKKKGRDILLRDTNTTINRIMKGRTPTTVVLNLEDYPPHLQQLLLDELKAAKGIDSLSLTHASLLTNGFFTSSLPWLNTLTKFDTRYCPQLTSDILPLLSTHVPNLQELNLAGCQGMTVVAQSRFLRDPGSLFFYRLERLVVNNCLNLKHIRIYAPFLQGLCAKDCPNLQTFKTFSLPYVDHLFDGPPGNLRSIDVRNNPYFEEEDLSRFFDIYPNLTNIRLEGCKKIDLIFKTYQTIMASYPSFKLRHLFTQYSGLIKKGFQKAQWMGEDLISLKLWRVTFDISILTSFSNLTSLGIIHTKTIHQQMENFRHFTNLQSLSLNFNTLGPQDVLYITHLSNLIDLDVSHNILNSIEPLVPLTQLRILNLRDNHIGPEGVSYITAFTNLTDLDLSRNKVGNQSTTSLAQLTSLVRLNLSNNDSITDEGVSLFTSLSNLTFLDLNASHITAAGTRFLASLTNLKTLDLAYNYIKHFDDNHGLIELTSLKTLNLEYNQIHDEGAKGLTSLTSLTFLDLRSEQIKDRDSIRKAFSHMKGLSLRLLGSTSD